MKKILVTSAIAAIFASCSKDADPIIIVPPSSGSNMTLDGGNGAASAENSVYVDFSADKQTSVLRNSWDLGFYCGSDFKVIINSTTAATAVAISKTDINSVTATDFDPDTLALGYGAGSFAVIDDPREANILNKTAIKEISAIESDNKVYIINRVGGTGTVDGPDKLYKIRILRTGQGYTLQYAKLAESSFKTINIIKNNEYNFVFINFDNGATTSVEPEKTNWDVNWSWNVYQTFSAQTGYIPYGFSDIVLINNLGGATAFERIYASSEVATEAYEKFNKDSVAKYSFSNNRMVIGSNWRLTVASGGEPAGIRKNRFYVIKDAAGNFYKLKFLAMGVASDGGERGKPQISYELIK